MLGQQDLYRTRREDLPQQEIRHGTRLVENSSQRPTISSTNYDNVASESKTPRLSYQKYQQKQSTPITHYKARKNLFRKELHRMMSEKYPILRTMMIQNILNQERSTDKQVQ